MNYFVYNSVKLHNFGNFFTVSKGTIEKKLIEVNSWMNKYVKHIFGYGVVFNEIIELPVATFVTKFQHQCCR